MKIVLTLLLGIILILLAVFIIGAGLALIPAGKGALAIVSTLVAGVWISSRIDPIP